MRKNIKPYVEQIINMYLNDKKSTYQIAKEIGFCQTSIVNVLSDNNITLRKYSESNRKYKINEHYFDEIDTQEKAYILGFLYADGCNSPDGKTVRLSLKSDDEKILEEMKKYSENETPIRKTKRKIKGKNGMGEYVDLQWNSKYVSSILSKWGVVPRKSLILKFPDWLSKELIPHFVRGYFDGDGSISKSGNGVQCSIISTCYFIDKLCNILEEKFNLHYTRSLSCPKYNDVTTTLKICTQKDVKFFLDWIYKDATIYLQRKYDRYYNNFYKDI